MKERKTMYLMALYIPVIAGTLIALAQIGFIIFLILNMPEKEMEVIPSLLSSGLAIIALAVSVWAGLNIANAIERRELNDTAEKIQILNKEVDKVQKTYSALKTSYLKQMAYYFAASDDLYYWSISSDIEKAILNGEIEEELNSLSMEYCIKLPQVALDSKRVCEYHKKSEKGLVKNIAPEARKNIEGLLKEYEKNHEEQGLIYQTLTFLEGETFFYEAFANNDRQLSKRLFNQSLKPYEEHVRLKYKIDLNDEDIEKKLEVIKNDQRRTDKTEIAYIFNTYGQVLSEMYHRTERNAVDELGKLAKRAQAANEFAVSLDDKELYCKNNGVILDRVAMNLQNLEEAENKLREASELYLRALQKGSSQFKTYSVYLAACSKRIKLTMACPLRATRKEVAQRFYEADEKQKDAVKQVLIAEEVPLDMALKVFPVEKAIYKFSAEWSLYSALINEDYERYEERINSTMKTLALLETIKDQELEDLYEEYKERKNNVTV